MRKILIVDDEPGIVRLLSNMVSANGFESISSETGTEAIELAIAEKPKVVLVDLLLDDIPGLAVMRRIKEKLPTTECIVVSGVPTKDAAISAVNLGAFGFITKPWDDDELLILIRSAFRHVEMAEALIDSEKRYRQLAESAQDLIFTVGRDMIVTYVNDSGADLLNSTAESLIGQDIKDVFANSDIERQKKNLEKVMETGESIVIQDEYKFAKVTKELNVRLSPLQNEKGHVVGVHGICRPL